MFDLFAADRIRAEATRKRRLERREKLRREGYPCPRCPKCKSKPKYYSEVWDGNSSIEFFTLLPDGRPNTSIGSAGGHTDGDPQYVRAVCHCGHEWRLRGMTQITDFDPK